MCQRLFKLLNVKRLRKNDKNCGMGLLNQRRPRGFRHEYMYADERKDRLKEIEYRAKAELGSTDTPQQRHDGIRGMFLAATKHARKRSERKLAGGFILGYGIIAVLLVILIAVWKMLLTM